MKLGNIILLLPILFVGLLFFKIELLVRNVGLYEEDMIVHTHTIHIITGIRIHTHITPFTTIPISVIEGKRILNF